MLDSSRSILMHHLDCPLLTRNQFGRVGIEKEFLRCTPHGFISQQPSSPLLGKTLTHPHITTDFSESQVEFVTPAYRNLTALCTFLTQLTKHTAMAYPDELFWPCSMPCRFVSEEEIPIAYYGNSEAGIFKYRYRKGLAARYGKKMQVISGIHYNFSFTKEFWDLLRIDPIEEKNTRNALYLHIIRNFLRYGSLLLYLYGASPCCDTTFSSLLESWDPSTQYLPYATSLRMSRYGYLTETQQELQFSYNDFSAYMQDLLRATSTTNPSYRCLDNLQLNDSFLQIPNEHYFYIRPKGKKRVKKHGIQHLEVRLLDLNPFTLTGIDLQQLEFVSYFLLFCLLEDSPHMDTREYTSAIDLFAKVATEGRSPHLIINGQNKEVFFSSILDKMKRWFPHLSLVKECSLIEHPDSTPSGKILRAMESHDHSFWDFSLRVASDHARALDQIPIHPSLERLFGRKNKQSLESFEAMPEQKSLLYGFGDMELSTQILIKEAQKRNIDVTIVDRSINLIRLGKNLLVRQATITDRDSLIGGSLLEEKFATKRLLEENGLHCPRGHDFTSVQEALDRYQIFADKKVVVKPNTTNFGKGISFIPPGNVSEYHTAIKKAFRSDTRILVEEFLPGKEYRFLILGGKLVAITEREAANIVGNGDDTIDTLIDKKNLNPLSYKFPATFLQKGLIEQTFLSSQGLAMHSIPASGEKIYLRANSNVSTGGDPIDMTEEVHLSYGRIAQEAALLLNMSICGIDMLIVDYQSHATATNYAILELNINPMLFFHQYPYRGQSRDVGKLLMDYLWT